MYYKSKTRKRGKVGKLVKSRKYSKLRKYSKKRRSTYKYRNKTQNFYKKRTTLERKRSRRKMYGGEGKCNNEVKRAIDATIASFPKGFKTFVDILETCPDVIHSVRDEYKKKIELKDHTRNSTGYVGLLGLQFINYLYVRITKLRNQRDSGDKSVILKIENLKTAISLMDQVAAAPAITGEQIPNIKEKVDTKYYDCYVKLYNKLASELKIENRMIPLSTSLCYFSQNCDSDSDVCNSDSKVCDNYCLPKFKRSRDDDDDEDIDE